MKDLAAKEGIPVFQQRGMKDPQVIGEYRRLAPDLNVLAFVTDILPAAVLDFPTHGSIQYHPSLLPRHRGRSAINWAVIQGETRTGLSIFWVDAGIDTGPVLLQKEVEIGPDDTTGSLYFDKLFPLGVEALVEAVALVKAGKAPRLVQDESRATYEPPCDEAAARIDWAKPLAEVYNLIRGCDPQPGAHAAFQGRTVKFLAARAFPGHAPRGHAAPGEILEVSDRGILLAASGGALLVSKLRPQGEGKMDAAAFARAAGVGRGARFS
jgi:methionyl-tRNA formyltransferase